MAASKSAKRAPAKGRKPVASGPARGTVESSAAGTKPKRNPAIAPTPSEAGREPKPKEELRVFALRMTPDERDRLHAAAGSAKATRFARAVLIAFSNADDAAFRRLVKEAEEGRAAAKK